VVRWWVDGDRERLAVATEVVIRACNALETNPADGFLATVTSCIVHGRAGLPHNQTIRFLYLHKTVARVLVRGDLKARVACIKIRTIETFVSFTIDSRITEVACGIVRNRSRWCRPGSGDRSGLSRASSRRLNRASRRGCARTRETRSIAIPFPVEHGVNNDMSRFFDPEELVSSRVLIPFIRDTRCTHIVVWAIQALVPDPTNNTVAHIT